MRGDAGDKSVSFAFWPHNFESLVNATVGGWPSGSIVLPSHALFQCAGY